MLLRLLQSKWWLSFFAALPLVLAYAPIDLWLFGVLTPFFFILLILKCETPRQALFYAFLTSVYLMIGGFYWVTYVIHEFGFLPWSVSGILYFGFCGIGALNWPAFAIGMQLFRERIPLERIPPALLSLWFSIWVPAWFTLLEYLVPKLFPWQLGNIFYRVPLIAQVCELTGVWGLSFALFSLASLGAGFVRYRRMPKWSWGIPIAMWVFILGFGFLRTHSIPPPTRPLHVAVIQANIGSLEKFQASQGVYEQVQHVVDQYLLLSEVAVQQQPRPDLLLWPETAIPVPLGQRNRYSDSILESVGRWSIPLITGGYSSSTRGTQNAAFLIEPKDGRGEIKDTYPKNVLLAFGEYMPFGEAFPILYRWFPEVSNFERGKTQKVFLLKGETRLAITICYELIVPDFVRTVARQGAQALINLTNDSWFGPTSEPYQHAQLTTYRSIETRLPLVRSTNTGISLTVDALGNLHERTSIYKEQILQATIDVPITAPQTLYLQWGDWWIVFCFFTLFILGFLIYRYSRAPLSI